MAESESLIDHAYLQEHHIKVYLEDAIVQFLIYRQEGNKSTPMKPFKFFKEYFTSVHQGTHVIFREFAFINATPYNRLCFLKAVMQVYKSLFYRDTKYNARDYHSILQLMVPDFGIQVVQDAFTAYDDEKKDEENRLKFYDFIKALKASFCTGEFDYEANLLKIQLEAKIEEFASAPSQSGETSMNISESDFFFNVEEDFMRKPGPSTHVFDVSELKKCLTKYDTSSSDDSISAEKPSGSSESKDASKSEKPQKKGNKKKSKGKKLTDKSKSELKSGSANLNRGRLPKKGLSTSLNVLQRGKSEDAEGTKPKIKIRQRSKSASNQRRSLSETVKPVHPVWRPPKKRLGKKVAASIAKKREIFEYFGNYEDYLIFMIRKAFARMFLSDRPPKKRVSKKVAVKSKDKFQFKSVSAVHNRNRLLKKNLLPSVNVKKQGKSENAEGAKPKIKSHQSSKAASNLHTSVQKSVEPASRPPQKHLEKKSVDKSQVKTGSACPKKGPALKKGCLPSVNVTGRRNSLDSEGAKPKIIIRRRSKSASNLRKSVSESVEPASRPPQKHFGKKLLEKSQVKTGSASPKKDPPLKKCLSTTVNVAGRRKSLDLEVAKQKIKIPERSKSDSNLGGSVQESVELALRPPQKHFEKKSVDKAQVKTRSASPKKGPTLKKGCLPGVNVTGRRNSLNTEGAKPKIIIRRRSKSASNMRRNVSESVEPASRPPQKNDGKEFSAKRKEITQVKSVSASQNRGRLLKKNLSTSVNVKQRGKSEDAEGAKLKIKVRPRSKSASNKHRSVSETVKPPWR